MKRFVRIGAASAVLATLFAGIMLRGTASAGATYCRSDPALTLSNGVVVTLYEDISDTSTDVTGITYQLHVPTGVTVTSITYQGAVPASLQSVTVYADETQGNYDGYTVVSTKTPKISVTAYMSANSTQSTHTNGSSGQTLHSHLHVS